MSLGKVDSPRRGKVQDACKFLTLQTTTASRRVSTELNEMLKERTQARKRRKIINEIIETEKTYQFHLSLVVDLFLEPMKVSGLVPDRVIEGIFCNVKALQAVNASLLEHIELEGVAIAFMKLAPFIKLYSLYANNFDHANKLVEEWTKKSPEFSRFCLLQERDEKMRGLKLHALLITPVQRVPRYKLLLENLVDKTTPDHEDYVKLKDACEEISRVAFHINECIRLHENFHKMLSIQNSLTGDTAPKILAPGRKFIRQGVLLKVCERGGAKERTVFLFNDILIYAKKETSCTYSCRGVFPIVSCLVEQVMGSTANLPGGGALFKVICKDKTLLLYSKVKDETDSWVKDIKDTISELHANLASLRRGDQTMSPEWDTQREKVRRDKERKKHGGSLNKFRLFECASPMICKDSLYPLREEVLPQLTEQAIKEEQDCRKPPQRSNQNSGSIKRRTPVDSRRKPTRYQSRKHRHESEFSLCGEEATESTLSQGIDNENFGEDTMTEQSIRHSLHLDEEFMVSGTPNVGYRDDEVFLEQESLKPKLEDVQECNRASTVSGELEKGSRVTPSSKFTRQRSQPSHDNSNDPYLGCDRRSHRIKKQSRKGGTTRRHRRSRDRPTVRSSSSLEYVGEQCSDENNVEILSIKSHSEEDARSIRYPTEDDEEMSHENLDYVPRIKNFSLTDGDSTAPQEQPDSNCQIM